jgi:hypothetical protein
LTENPAYSYRRGKRHQVWWFMSVIPAFWEADWKSSGSGQLEEKVSKTPSQ